MLKFGNKEFRNLQEQVLRNMKNIQDIMDGTTVLAEFGIKVIGHVNSAADLPDPETYEGEYGDAYVVGTEEPYNYYIFTRAFEGDETPQWFNLGVFPAPGPQGETGPQGPVGPQGPQGNTGADGSPAGFGSITATAQTLVPGSSATATVVASGPDNEKSFAFTFGIPRGQDGSSDVNWGDIGGTLADQTDLQTALNSKADGADVVHLTGAETITGIKTFIDTINIKESQSNFVELKCLSSNKIQIGSSAGASSTLRLGDANGGGSHRGQLEINADGEITCEADDYGIDAYLQLPAQGTSSQRATLATLGDIPSLANYVTLDGAQSITGYKTFNRANTDDPIFTLIGGWGANAKTYDFKVSSDALIIHRNGYAYVQFVLKDGELQTQTLKPAGLNTNYSLGGPSNYGYYNLYLRNKIYSNNNDTYGLVLPDTTN